MPDDQRRPRPSDPHAEADPSARPAAASHAVVTPQRIQVAKARPTPVRPVSPSGHRREADWIRDNGWS